MKIKVLFILSIFILTLSLKAKDQAALTIMGLPDSCIFALISFWDKNGDDHFDTSFLYNCENKYTKYNVKDKDNVELLNGMLAYLNYGNIDSNNWYFTVIHPDTKDTISKIYYENEFVIIDKFKLTDIESEKASKQDEFTQYIRNNILTITNINTHYILKIEIFDILGNSLYKQNIFTNQQKIYVNLNNDFNMFIITKINTGAGIYFIKSIIN